MTEKIGFIDAFELAMHILSIEDDPVLEDNEDFDDLVERRLFEEYGMELGQLLKLLNAITPLIEIAESPLTNTLYKGFASDNCWLVKIHVKLKL